MKKVLVLVLVFMIFSFASNAEESCFYPDKTVNGSFLHSDECGSIQGDNLKLDKRFLDNVFYDANDLACLLFSAKDAFYVHKNGASQRVYFYDNGCDYFKEDLARGVVNDKMVFINNRLKVLISPGFELLSHFDYGHSVVCNGPFEEELQGEHSFLKGGRCGLMNRQGTLVVEAIHNIENRDAFQQYLNNSNHCLRPPVVSQKSALCHAKRHVSNMTLHTGQWAEYAISKHDKVWLITFVEEGSSSQFTLTLNAISGQWTSLISTPTLNN